MATGMNKVFLMGNLGDDPELRHHPNGDRLRMRLATTEKYYDRHDRSELKEVTHWHNVSLWGNRATALSRILSKGDRIVIEGRLESHSYEDAQGQSRVYVEVKARDVMLAGGRRTVPAPSFGTRPSPRRGTSQPPPLPVPESLTMVSPRPTGEALREARA